MLATRNAPLRGFRHAVVKACGHTSPEAFLGWQDATAIRVRLTIIIVAPQPDVRAGQQFARLSACDYYVSDGVCRQHCKREARRVEQVNAAPSPRELSVITEI